MTLIRSTLSLFAASLLTAMAALAQNAERLEIQNQSTRVVVERFDEIWHETYYARIGSSWREVVESGSSARPDPALRENGANVPVRFLKAFIAEKADSDKGVVLEAELLNGVLVKSISLGKDDPFVKIDLVYRVRAGVRLESLLSTYSFAPGGMMYSNYQPLDFIFTPQLRPEKEHIIADHTFRSPALMMQKGKDFAALVPDLQELDGKGRLIRTVADLQVQTADRPFFSIGLENWIPEPYQLRNTHVFYVTPDSLSRVISRDTMITTGFLLFLRSDAPEGEGYRDIVRYHWNTSGTSYMQRSIGPQSEPFANYVNKAWYQFLPQIALDGVYKGKPVTLLRQARLAWSNKLPKQADNDCWFNVWFSSVRTAYGMYLHARTVNDRALMKEATNVLNLALLAPQQHGIAPTIFYLDSAGGHWVDDQAWGSIDDGRDYPMFANSWTNYWLLKWIDLVPGRQTEILRFTKAFAEVLLSNQQASGVIPSWYDPVTLKPVETFRDENAETAGAALFLTAFYERTKDTRYLKAAERAMHYIATSIVPKKKWFDHETFFSCSRKPLGFFDSYTQQNPQNTLSMHQAAEACCELYHVTGRQEYKDLGCDIMDYLCLFQQVWSPRWLSRELFGGFGVQNTDAEWSDARQGYFAVTLMSYYELTGKKEYFERGVAALRSMFSLFESPQSPRTAENYAHSGFDRPAGVTGIHWGTGSCVVSIHIITKQYGDAYVDVQGGWGAGIDGCRIPSVEVGKSSIRVEVVDNLASPRTVRLRFGKITGRQFDVTVNGKRMGRLSAGQLARGIDIAI